MKYSEINTIKANFKNGENPHDIRKIQIYNLYSSHDILYYSDSCDTIDSPLRTYNTLRENGNKETLGPVILNLRFVTFR